MLAGGAAAAPKLNVGAWLALNLNPPWFVLADGGGVGLAPKVNAPVDGLLLLFWPNWKVGPFASTAKPARKINKVYRR